MPSLEPFQCVLAIRRRRPAAPAGDEFAHTRIVWRTRRPRFAKLGHATVQPKTCCRGKQLRTATGPPVAARTMARERLGFIPHASPPPPAARRDGARSGAVLAQGPIPPARPAHYFPRS
jgi:hypothetical protein